jgi:hypothetical protein
MAPRRDATFQSYGGRHIDEFALRMPDGRLILLGDATWADWDHRGRLVIARDGALQEIDADTLDTRTIFAFRRQAPDPQPAPAEASRWPAGPAG